MSELPPNLNVMECKIYLMGMVSFNFQNARVKMLQGYM